MAIPTAAATVHRQPENHPRPAHLRHTGVPAPDKIAMEFFTRVEGQWDFDGVGTITTSTGGTYKPDEFGVVIGAGLNANISESVTFNSKAQPRALAAPTTTSTQAQRGLISGSDKPNAPRTSEAPIRGPGAV